MGMFDMSLNWPCAYRRLILQFLFKKYLDFEKAHGDEDRVQYVKTKAMEYVEAKLG